MSRFQFLYSNINKKAFWITLTISIVLIITSFLLPPKGAVDPSVLTAAGELMGFATLGTVIEAIEKGHRATFSKGDANLTIDTDTEPTTFGKETEF